MSDSESSAHSLDADERLDQIMKRLRVTDDADVNIKDRENGKTALHLAAESRREDTVSYLIERGANVNARDAEGRTALHYYSSSGIASALMQAGCDIEASDKHSIRPIHLAARINEKVVLALIERGADLSARDDMGRTALHYAGSPTIVKLLLKAGADIEAKDTDDGSRPIHLAARDDEEVALTLIKHGADVGARKDDDSTALHFTRSARLARALIEEGCDIEAEDVYARRPLHAVSSRGCDEVVSVLIESGADIEARNIWRGRPLHVAASEKVARRLLEAGAELDVGNYSNETPLYYAADRRHGQVVEVLLEYGANIYGQTCGRHTPVSWVWRYGYFEILGILFSSIRLRAAGLLISKENLALANYPAEEYPDYTTKHEASKYAWAYQLKSEVEVKQLKMHKLIGSVTMHDILSAATPQYLSNEASVGALNSIDLSVYPIYGEFITNKLRNDQLKTKLLVSADKHLELLLSYGSSHSTRGHMPSLPKDVRLKVLAHLDVADLGNLIECGESAKELTEAPMS